jgi:hypothetical protein
MCPLALQCRIAAAVQHLSNWPLTRIDQGAASRIAVGVLIINHRPHAERDVPG